MASSSLCQFNGRIAQYPTWAPRHAARRLAMLAMGYGIFSGLRGLMMPGHLGVQWMKSAWKIICLEHGLYFSLFPYGFVWKCCVPLNPMVLLIIIPTKWLFHWGYTPFSDIPIYWECHHPNWGTPSIFRGLAQPPARLSWFSSRGF